MYIFIIIFLFLIFYLLFSKKTDANYEKEKLDELNHQLKRNRGEAGEFYMLEELKQVSGEKLFLKNCYLPTMHHHTTEVDVIMLHEKGIFVFESKKRGGKIMGDAYDQDWMQVLVRNNGEVLKHPFYNPMRQNQTHMNALAHYLNCNQNHMHSFIVFDFDAIISNNLLQDDQHVVTTLINLKQDVSAYLEELPVVYSKPTLQRMYTRLKATCNVSDKRKQEHQEDVRNKDFYVDEKIKEKYVIKESQPEVQYCPKCGSKLIKARVDHGENKGKLYLKCQNFPRCLYTELVDE